MHSIVNNHPLIDGNKRLGWLSAAVFLELNGSSVLAAANDDVYDLVIDVAATDVDLEVIATKLANLA